jgi:(p)ppGpp synthase/HD superfamily hydrolase
MDKKLSASSMFEKAMRIVFFEFKSNLDKGGQPYHEHLFYVSNRAVDEYCKNSISSYQVTTIKVVGLLHDLLEDKKDWTIEDLKKVGFSDVVTEAIDLLTKKDNQTYDEYIDGISKNQYAICVKLADLEHNMDLRRLTEVTEKDFERFLKYKKAYDYLLKLNNA